MEIEAYKQNRLTLFVRISNPCSEVGGVCSRASRSLNSISFFVLDSPIPSRLRWSASVLHFTVCRSFGVGKRIEKGEGGENC